MKLPVLALAALLLVGCNKDEDIISSDNPNDPGQNPPQEEQPVVLDYEVVEYTPAPGQFINEAVSGFADVTTQTEACRQAEKRLSKGLYVSLGSWGGYIVVKFKESIPNSGGYDFSISSNSFDTSSEPGIVWVMQDTNGNGLPDDTWFELKGSHFGEEGYERNYWVTYTRPGAKENTPWTDSNGETGEVRWLGSYHSQDFYYPNWVKADSYTLYGSRLPSQAVQDPISKLWSNLPFAWGYADNFGEDFFVDGKKNQFKISNAVTEMNQPADLTSVDFVKVQTAVNGEADLLGEISTEVCGFFKH